MCVDTIRDVLVGDGPVDSEGWQELDCVCHIEYRHHLYWLI